MTSSSPDRRRPWRAIMAVTVAATVVAAGAVALTGHHTRTRAALVPASSATAAPSRFSKVAGGSPPGETPQEAAEAAAVIVGDEPLLVDGPASSASALVASWATPAARPGLQGAVRSARAGFVSAAGGPFSFDTAVLADRVDSVGPGRVAVDDWCAEVLFERDAPMSADYVTEHLTLVWWGGRWLLGSITDVSGPLVSLAGTPTPAAEAAAALAGYTTPAAATRAVGDAQGDR